MCMFFRLVALMLMLLIFWLFCLSLSINDLGKGVIKVLWVKRSITLEFVMERN